MWPQITLIVIVTLGMGISMEQHGKRKDGEEKSCIPTLLSKVVLGLLLYWGGFFDCFFRHQ